MRVLFLFVSIIYSSQILVSQNAFSEDLLPNVAPVYYCPFVPANDPFNFSGLSSAVRSLLEAKIDQNTRCTAPLNNLLSNLNAFSDSYTGMEPGLLEDVSIDVYSQYQADLSVELASLENMGLGTSEKASLVRNALQSIERLIVDNKVAFLFQKKSIRKSSEGEFRRKLYGYLNSLLQTLNGMDSRCLDLVENWPTLMPSLLGAVSMASGVGSISNQTLLAPALQLFAGLVSFLSNHKVKSALNDLNEYQNDKLLACTYYALKRTACEYGRNFKISQNSRLLKEALEWNLRSPENTKYNQLFDILERLGLFQGIFDQIATMGSALTLDLGTLFSYLEAKRIDPDTIADIPDGANDTEKQSWIFEVKNRGINVNDRDNSTGKPIPLNEQVKNAREEIKNKKSIISALQVVLSEKRSFKDLRDNLDSSFSNALDIVKRAREYFFSFLIGNEEGFPERQKGVFLSALDLLGRVQEFLEVEVHLEGGADGLTPSDQYEKDVNEKGMKLFESMARGAIAQINKQTVLALGNKATDRIKRAVQVIENFYLAKELKAGHEVEGSYTKARRDRLALYHILDNYAHYSPPGYAFKDGDVQKPLESFENGFEDEIKRMVERSSEMTVELVPELQGKSSPHLCSLFASTLSKTRGGRNLLDRCKKQFSTLEQIALIQEAPIAIDFSNPCFYSEYINIIEAQKLLFLRYSHYDQDSFGPRNK